MFLTTFSLKKETPFGFLVLLFQIFSSKTLVFIGSTDLTEINMSFEARSENCMLTLAYSHDLHSSKLEIEGQGNCHVTCWHCLTPF